ncbi:Tryptophan aminotransferase-related protein 3 [Platanthera zijinensis]|uniref:Tryptophan aminotransferase-related protein 3 n=1 Tax=Platanthera zijinensis TaxID=2320716 RepID=A0AAP0B6P2_9ASPA
MMGGTTKSQSLGLKLVVLILASLFLNVFFGYYYVRRTVGREKSDWSASAAEEAEEAGAVYCSGHGRAYLDGKVVDGEPVCECNTCYTGEDCSLLTPDCPADANSGDPLFLEPYWRRNAARSAVLVAGWHRMSYRSYGDSPISLELERYIRLLHDAVGNAVTDGRFIVFGIGSSQLLNAAVHSLSPDAVNVNSSSSPASVVATVPFYGLYKSQTEFFDSREYEWEGAAANWVNSSASSSSKFVEFVTSPNNPDGLLMKSALDGSSVIHDHAYYWPHYTAIPTPADEEVMTFTASKVSGHAGSRFGWALVKNKSVYQKMLQYLSMNTLSMSVDTQLRMLKIFKVILAELRNEGDIFKFGYKILNRRWTELNNIMSPSRRFSLQKLSPQYCSYFQKIRDPSPAYAWVKCEREEDADCEAVLKEAGIISRAGTAFDAESRYTRLSLIKTNDDFDQLLLKIEALVSKELLSSI